MTDNVFSRILSLVMRAVVGYAAYLFAIPAIVLQAMAFLFGAVSAYILALSNDVGLVERAVARVARLLDVRHISYEGNPIPSLLGWYAVAALVLDLAVAAWCRLFPNARLRRRTVCVALIAADAACYAFFAAAGLEAGEGVGPAAILLAITAFFTLVAFAAGRVRRSVVRALDA